MCVCVCVRVKFTQRNNGRESFHQLNTSTRSLNGYSGFITFIDTHTRTHTHLHTHTHTHRHACMHTVRRCIKINASVHEACAHAIPHVCTITEEVNFIKGQRTQKESWSELSAMQLHIKNQSVVYRDDESEDASFHSCQHPARWSFTVSFCGASLETATVTSWLTLKGICRIIIMLSHKCILLVFKLSARVWTAEVWTNKHLMWKCLQLQVCVRCD